MQKQLVAETKHPQQWPCPMNHVTLDDQLAMLPASLTAQYFRKEYEAPIAPNLSWACPATFRWPEGRLTHALRHVHVGELRGVETVLVRTRSAEQGGEVYEERDWDFPQKLEAPSYDNQGPLPCGIHRFSCIECPTDAEVVQLDTNCRLEEHMKAKTECLNCSGQWLLCKRSSCTRSLWDTPQ